MKQGVCDFIMDVDLGGHRCRSGSVEEWMLEYKQPRLELGILGYERGRQMELAACG